MFIVALWQRINDIAKIFLPTATAVLFALMSVIPWPLPYFGPIAPSLALIAVYYWAVHRPDLFSPGVVFLVGIFNDAVNDLPFGASALIFVAAHQLVLSQRRLFVRQSFFMLWFGFALTMFCASIGQWGVISIYGWQAQPVLPVFLQCLLTIAIFPLPAWVLIRIQRTFITNS